MHYRAEVDGLRAVAVGAVILCHAGLPLVSGGYFGVDVFFAISGYLITNIITRELCYDTFSIKHFYERRVRRIIPALLVMIILSIPLAYLLMLPDALRSFGQSIVATSLFANNVLLLLTSGYFAVAADFKPLMHTWSLSVEEQYYVVIPLLMLFLVRRAGIRGIATAMFAICIASIAASLLVSAKVPEARFLLLPFRAWELGFGALAALWGSRLCRSVKPQSSFGHSIAGASFVLILLPMLWPEVGKVTPAFPGLLAVVGACLFLIFGRADSGPGRALATKPFVWLGLISYSAYLYHQPLFAFLRLSRLDEPTTMEFLALIPLIIGLAWLSWRFVEKPFRNPAITPLPNFKPRLVSALSCLISIGMIFHLTSGFYKNWPELAAGDAGFGSNQNIVYNLRPAKYTNKPFDVGPPHAKLLVAGDSFARDFINMALDADQPLDADISYVSTLPCNGEPIDPRLVSNLEQASLVVIAAAFSSRELPCLHRLLERWKPMTQARILVLGQKNFGWNNNAVMRLPVPTRYTYRATPVLAVAALNALARSQFDSSTYVDILQILSDTAGRVPVFTADRKFVSYDTNHLTQAGARFVGSILFKQASFSDIAPRQAGK